MKNVMKVFLTILLGVAVALMTTQVFAADSFEREFENAYDFSSNPSSGGSSANRLDDDEEEEEDDNYIDFSKNSVNNTSVNNTSVNNTSVNNTSVNNTTANRNSSYNNTNLPKTGAEDVLPVAALVIVFGISAVFAYKKVSDYRNI